jgi:hypothetical protein
MTMKKPTFDEAMKALENAGAKVYVSGTLDLQSKKTFLDGVLKCPHCKNTIMQFVCPAEAK